ncbi:uncharacterized protein [Coffea arabica]|uniref:CCHC-type domain-containing protein n=1 Tax=Coffea arabica TaxID=13443 RepID=A0A6P6VG59_COFAR
MSNGEESCIADSKLAIEAMMSEFQYKMRLEFDSLHERMDHLENSQNRSGTSQGRSNRAENGASNDEYEEDEGHLRAVQNNNKRSDDQIKGIKLKIPSIRGKSDPKAYLEWERKIEMIFECNSYTNKQKVKLAAVEFIDYASVWWNQLHLSCRRNCERAVENWEELQGLMWKRFVPNYYHRDLHNRLQTLTQGTMFVEVYYKEMKMAMMRADVQEDLEPTMSSFLNGLRPEIVKIVQLQHYLNMIELLDKALKVEMRLKKRGNTHLNSNSQARSWHDPPSKCEDKYVEPSQPPKSRPMETKPPTKIEAEVGTRTSKLQSGDAKCFKCQGFGHIASQCSNQRTMLILLDREVVSDNKDDCEGILPLVEESDNLEEELPSEGNVGVLVVRKMHAAQALKDEDVQQDKLFYTHYHIKDKLCSLIIDGDSCTNVASLYMVEKLVLSTTKHPKRYRLQWLNKDGGEQVYWQVKVPFCIGKYEDEMVCDVVPMQASHLILCRPWQYNKAVHFDGCLNKYSFMHYNRKVTLVPLTPRQIQEDQVRLHEEYESECELRKKEKSETVCDDERKALVSSCDDPISF